MFLTHISLVSEDFLYNILCGDKCLAISTSGRTYGKQINFGFKSYKLIIKNCNEQHFMYNFLIALFNDNKLIILNKNK